ncbi:MAG TPA: hypothetical protein VK447_01315 [Myxococcaceae bacterium]|nr:hypothetical protein [Myxococcaceae bacterium]
MQWTDSRSAVARVRAAERRKVALLLGAAQQALLSGRTDLADKYFAQAERASEQEQALGEMARTLRWMGWHAWFYEAALGPFRLTVVQSTPGGKWSAVVYEGERVVARTGEDFASAAQAQEEAISLALAVRGEQMAA